MKVFLGKQPLKALRGPPAPHPLQSLMPSRRSQRILSPKKEENPVIPPNRQPLNDRIKKEVIRFRPLTSRRSQRILSPKQRDSPVIQLKLQPLNDGIKKEIIRFRFHYNWKVAVSRDDFIRSLVNHLKAKLPQYPISSDTVLKWIQLGHSWIMNEHTKPKGTALYQRVIDELVREEAANTNSTYSQASQVSRDRARRMESDEIEDHDDEYFEEMNRRLAHIESGMTLVMETLKLVLSSERGLFGPGILPGTPAPSRRNEQSGSNVISSGSQTCDNDIIIPLDGTQPCDDDVIIIFDGTQPRTSGIRSQSSSINIRGNAEGSVPGSRQMQNQTLASHMREVKKIPLQFEPQEKQLQCINID